MPVMRSHAGKTWLTGTAASAGPVIRGTPTSALIGVVDGRLAIAPTLDVDVDDVPAASSQLLVAQTPRPDQVVDEDASVTSRADHQLHEQLSALVLRWSIVTDRLPLLRLAQNRLAPVCDSGQRPASLPPPGGSTRMTSAPSWLQRHARRGSRDERGGLDDPEAAQRAWGGRHRYRDPSPSRPIAVRASDRSTSALGSWLVVWFSARRASGLGGQADVTGDEHALDLVRPVVDLGDLGVAQSALRTE